MKFLNSITAKIVGIGILIFVFLVPTYMVENLSSERRYNQKQAVEDISEKYAKAQSIAGGFFIVPYKTFYINEKKQVEEGVEHFYLLPKNLNLHVSLNPHVRYRGIYEAVLYESDMDINGEFDYTFINDLNIEKKNILWDSAMFSLGISDLRGVGENIHVNIGDKTYFLKSGLKDTRIFASGASVRVPIDLNAKQEKFSLSLKLKGSSFMDFIPLGEVTNVSIKSDWSNPSFMGSFLPTSRNISENGFDANWKILHLNRSFSQVFKAHSYTSHGINKYAFGVKFLITNDIYQKVDRILKYAIMFIVLTFGAFFFSEVITKRKIHPIEYLLVGFAILLFYVLLLALSEHFGFNPSYLGASALITLLVTAFSSAILKNKLFTVSIFCTLVVIYGFLFVVLQLEDYALLIGSLGLFVALSIIMYITRDINWYEENAS